jgi:hypothetical protein
MERDESKEFVRIGFTNGVSSPCNLIALIPLFVVHFVTFVVNSTAGSRIMDHGSGRNAPP